MNFKKGERVSWWIYKYWGKSENSLHTKSWQHLRQDLMVERGPKCEACQVREGVVPHHTYYIEGKRAYAYPLSVFWLLCKECHDRLHKTTTLYYELTLGEFRDWLRENIH